VSSEARFTEVRMRVLCAILKFVRVIHSGHNLRRTRMLPDSPGDALGAQAAGVRDLVVDVVRSRHDKAAEAHQVSGSRYGLGFGSQWRDLLDDTHDALMEREFRSHKLAPGGHKVGVVNDCLVYVWRVPDDPNAVQDFASSPTRQNGFAAPPPPAMLWESLLTEEVEPAEDASEAAETASLMEAVRDTMPLVLVMVWSTPRQLQSIEWAVASLDDSGKVELRGQESLWKPESVADDVSSEVESFDSGKPVGPTIEPREQDGPSDA